jgi:GrpB-like predicted nucleotidyltransferase (UPF0157 family)
MELTPYTHQWAATFRQEKDRLLSLLGNDALDIQHIGSTAIPEIVSKPIVDIMALLPTIQNASKYLDSLHTLGYFYSKERSSTERYFFTKGDPVSVHLSLTDKSTPYWDRQLAFRDYLLAHREIAKEYEVLKRSLIEHYPSGKDKYSYGKSEFVAAVLRKAGFSVS